MSVDAWQDDGGVLPLRRGHAVRGAQLHTGTRMDGRSRVPRTGRAYRFDGGDTDATFGHCRAAADDQRWWQWPTMADGQLMITRLDTIESNEVCITRDKL